MNKVFIAAASALVAGHAAADITGVIAVSSTVTAADFGGANVTVNVQDLYAVGDSIDDVVLNVFNVTLSSSASSTTFFQSFTGTGWQPNNLGAPFDTEALQYADSFVTIGGFGADGAQAPGAGAGTGLDPNFGGNGAAAPGALAGWFNSSPPSLNGQVMTYDDGTTGVLLGRFSSTDSFTLEGTTLKVTYNQGLGTDPVQPELMTVTPTPGAVALLGLAGIAARRRRG